MAIVGFGKVFMRPIGFLAVSRKLQLKPNRSTWDRGLPAPLPAWGGGALRLSSPSYSYRLVVRS